MKNKILFVAYHYPPISVSSGVHRTLKFTQYLPEYGWLPLVLTIHPRTYERVDEKQLKDIPECVEVKRPFAFDTARHLSIAGRYPGFMAIPDRWITWWFSGVITGLKIIQKHKPRVIVSTYPIATAHLIALTLHKLTGVPWVADFRDSMTEEHYPPGKFKWKIFRFIERKAVENASRVIFTTSGTVKMYSERYPDIPKDHWVLIENGFDEDNFLEVESNVDIQPKENKQCIKLVHSGVLYPSERDPTCFFQALKELKDDGKIDSSSLQVVLRGSGHEEYFQPLLREYGINDIVQLALPVNYFEAMSEMLSADGLLIFQASNCNHQIPAKIYEYLRSRRPVFAMTDSTGNTAEVLRDADINTIAALDSTIEIKEGLLNFLSMIQSGNAPIASDEAILRHTRKYKTKLLSEVLDSFKIM